MRPDLPAVRSPAAALAAFSLAAALPFLTVALWRPYFYGVLTTPSYLVFHNVAELFSVLVSLSVFGVGWFTYAQSRDRHALFLGAGFLGVGLMDLMHTLGYAGMPAFVTPNSANKSTQFWVAVRFFTAVVLLGSAFLARERPTLRRERAILLAGVLAFSGVVFTLVTFFPSSVPATFVEGAGLTPFKKNSEYAIIALLCLAAFLYWRRFARSGERTLAYILAAVVLSIVSELVFASYQSVFDTYNVLGHVYKVGAFSLIYSAIFVASVKRPHLRLLEKEGELRADMCARRKAEEAVEAERRRLNDVLETLPVYLVLLSPDYRVPFANRFFRERFGESHGKRCYEYLFGRAEPCETCETFTVLKTKKPHRWEWVGPDGRTYDIHDFPFPDTDGSTLIMEAGIDITDLKRAEVDLRRMNEQLEERVRERTRELSAANEELESFSYSVSHDLRAPLRAVDGFSRMLEEDYGRLLDAEGRRIVEVIRSETCKMGQLIDDLLAFSRIGRRELKSDSVDMTRLAHSVCDEVAQANPGRNLRFVVGTLPPAVGDASMLRQVLVNLITNAAKFTRLRANAVVEVRGRSAEEEDLYSVEDNGVGFDMQYAQKLFGVFQRLHDAEAFEGTGVGLAIVQRLVQRHGGRVWAEGAVDRGATFGFALPRRRERAAAEPAQEGRAHGCG